jgi:hypothetical protein
MDNSTEILRIPIAKSERRGRQNLVFGWANVPYPVAKAGHLEPGESLEDAIADVSAAYHTQFPNDPDNNTWRWLMATFEDHVIVEVSDSSGSSFLQHNFVVNDDSIVFGEGVEVERVFVAKALADQDERRRVAKAAKVDLEGDRVALTELEQAAYNFTLTSGLADIDHDEVTHGRLVESFVVTDEKLEAMGVPEDARAQVSKGWWLGFHVDDATMDRVETGELSMFSIGGQAKRTPAA